MKTSKTEIFAESHRIFTIRRGARQRIAWCDECGEQVRMVPTDEAAILASVSSRTIYQRIEAGELHFAEASDRVLFICLKSLENLS
jgi:hypothetical protein